MENSLLRDGWVAVGELFDRQVESGQIILFWQTLFLTPSKFRHHWEKFLMLDNRFVDRLGFVEFSVCNS